MIGHGSQFSNPILVYSQQIIFLKEAYFIFQKAFGKYEKKNAATLYMVNFLHLKTEVHFSTSWNSLTRKSSRRFPTCLVKLAPIPYRVSQSKMNIFRRLIDNFEKNMYLGQVKSHSYFQILFIYIHKCQEAVHKLCRLKINKF